MFLFASFVNQNHTIDFLSSAMFDYFNVFGFFLFFLPMYALMRLSYTVLIESPVPFVCININFPLLFYFHAQ